MNKKRQYSFHRNKKVKINKDRHKRKRKMMMLKRNKSSNNRKFRMCILTSLNKKRKTYRRKFRNDINFVMM